MKNQFKQAYHWQKLSWTNVKLDNSLLGQQSICQWLQHLDVSLSNVFLQNLNIMTVVLIALNFLSKPGRTCKHEYSLAGLPPPNATYLPLPSPKGRVL